nr:retrovirus-related Pol polyprotein from transposon TNT 1-94 [Tanacetum cinerariifolium]
MSTQQDIYVAGSENRTPMLNKENYVPWSSRLLWYAKSRPNGRLIHNSIINGPYVRRMILEPGDSNREVPVNETFHVQTDDELTEKELKQIEVDDQAIQTIPLGLPEDIYPAVDSCETAQEIWNHVIQNAVQNPRVQNVGNQNGLIGVPGNANQNLNRNGNLVVTRAEGNATGHNGNQIRCYNCRGVGIQLQAEEFDLMATAVDLDEIEEVNANCILMANLQQASTSGTQTDKAPVYDSDRSAEYTELLKPILKSHQVPHNDNNVISKVTSVEQSGETVEQHPTNVDETQEHYTELLEPIPELHQVPQNDNDVVSELVEIILFIVDFRCSTHMTGNLKFLTNFMEKFLGTVKFENDQIAPILVYGDLVQGTITIRRVYYIEGLNHNLFSVGQFCDAYLEVAFQKSTCYIQDLKGNDLITGSHGTDLYFINLQDTSTPNLICLKAKATLSQAWLWHRRLSHLNFDSINLLSKNNIVIGLTKLKFIKDHLCSSYELGKAK